MSIPAISSNDPNSEAKFAAWTRSLGYHQLANTFPLIEGDDFRALVEDIRKNGIRESIIVYQGKILDGRNRYRAALEAGHRFTERDFRELSAGLDAESYVISTNLQRRHLDTKGKRAVIANLIEKYTKHSNREIAARAGVDPKTVKSVREEIENRAARFVKELDQLTPLQWQKVLTERGDMLWAKMQEFAKVNFGKPPAAA
jgi:hypothetical protein